MLATSHDDRSVRKPDSKTPPMTPPQDAPTDERLEQEPTQEPQIETPEEHQRRVRERRLFEDTIDF